MKNEKRQLIFNFHFSLNIEKWKWNRRSIFIFLWIKKLKIKKKNENLCSIFFCFWTKKNENLWSIFFSFFLTQNGNETNRGNKEKQPITIQQFPAKLLSFASLNQPRSCSSVSVAMKVDYIILEWRVERRVKNA